MSLSIKHKSDRAIAVWVMMGLYGMFGFFVITLLFFHIFLVCKGVTTYEYMFPAPAFEQAKEDIKKVEKPSKPSSEGEEQNTHNVFEGELTLT